MAFISKFWQKKRCQHYDYLFIHHRDFPWQKMLVLVIVDWGYLCVQTGNSLSNTSQFEIHKYFIVWWWKQKRKGNFFSFFFNEEKMHYNENSQWCYKMVAIFQIILTSDHFDTEKTQLTILTLRKSVFNLWKLS